jgi:hypothetical protein
MEITGILSQVSVCTITIIIIPNSPKVTQKITNFNRILVIVKIHKYQIILLNHQSNRHYLPNNV